VVVEVRPASVRQVVRGRTGRFVEVPADPQNVAEDLRRIDPNLRVRYNVDQRYWVVYREKPLPDGRVQKDLVLTALDLDQRIVKRVEYLYSRDYDYARELEQAEKEARKRARDEVGEMLGAAGERLHHALRKDMGDKSRAFIGGER